MKIVHSKLSCVSCFEECNILPGMNNVSDPIFDKLFKTKSFNEMVSSNRFIIGGSYETENSTAIESKDMKTQSQKTAEEIKSITKKDDLIAVVSQCNDPYVLKHLKNIDSRKGTQDLIEKRLTEIETQENTDLRPEHKEVSDNGSDFMGKIPKDNTALGGDNVISAIPALNRG